MLAYIFGVGGGCWLGGNFLNNEKNHHTAQNIDIFFKIEQIIGQDFKVSVKVLLHRKILRLFNPIEIYIIKKHYMYTNIMIKSVFIETMYIKFWLYGYHQVASRGSGSC